MIDRKEIRSVLRQAFYLMTAIVALSFCANIIHPRGFVFVSRESQRGAMIVPVSAEEAKIKFDSSAIFVDSRDGSEYSASHVRGALHIPAAPDSLSLARIKANMEVLAGKRELVLYCNKNCNTAELLAERLMESDYQRHIYIMKDGFELWVKKGYPLDR
jgi:rhodanese-related sulfurtransferase